MNDKILETEIENATRRIDFRKSEIDMELQELVNQIDKYTNWAWRFVWFGVLIAFISIIIYLCRNTDTGFGLNLLGDFMAGTVASIWSLAGLFFIYVAFLGQKQQLLNQQIEIMYSQLEVKYTRLELEGQKKEMIEQNKTLKQQRFENTFFQLLRNHQDIVNSIDLRKGTVLVSKGRDCFKTFNKYFKDKIALAKNPTDIDSAVRWYMAFFDEHQSDLGHYYRHMYQILKFVDRSDEIEAFQKFKYINLLRALLSSYELVLLFYNCLGDYGEDDFLPLVIRYSFLKNLDWDLLIVRTHAEAIDEIAFASSKRRNEILRDRESRN